MKFLKWFDNYWYHYKFHTAVALILAVVIAYAGITIFSRENYDYKVVLYMSQPSSPEFNDTLTKTLEKYGLDSDGDGEVNIQLMHLSYDPVKSDLNYQQSQATTLSGELQNRKTFLFITDDVRFDELNELNAFSKQTGFDKKDGKAFRLDKSGFGKKLEKNLKKVGIKEEIPTMYLSMRVTPPEDEMTDDARAAIRAKNKIVKVR